MSDQPAFLDAAATWDRRYAGDDLHFGTRPNAWLERQAAHLPAGGRILCVADGKGRNGIWLAQQGFRVEPFDVSPRAVDKARAWAAREGVAVDFAVTDVDGHAWEEAAFDGVVAIFVQFAEPPMRARMFERIVRSLKPGGVLILQGYTPAQLTHGTGGPPIPSHLDTADMLREAFAQLTILRLEEGETVLQEGAGHRGVSAVIGLVARR